MSVEQVHAFKISDGSCYENKQSAYTAETTHLYRTLPRADNKVPVAKEFGKFVRSVNEWRLKAEALVVQMDTEQDVETKRSITGQG